MNNLMGIYPKALNKILRKKKIRGQVLELGSGVGNLTKLIQDYCDVIPSDLSVSFINEYNPNDKAIRIDFNEKFDIPPGTEAVVSCNALHCADNKCNLMKHLYRSMEKGSSLIIAEGNRFMYDEVRWPFDFVFQLFDGWFDNSGFGTEEGWVSVIYQAGFSQIEINRIRSGNNQIGMVICAKK